MTLLSRIRARQVSSARRAVLYQAAAWCLHYPDDALYAHEDLLRQCLDEMGQWPPAARLRTVVDYLRDSPSREVQQHYIEVFDSSPRRSLYLTWYLYGDTRLRGQALATLAERYRDHGYRVTGGELPDYLPVLLEFTAGGGAFDEGERLLGVFRPALKALFGSLDRLATPYVESVGMLLDLVPATAHAPSELGFLPR